MNFIDAFILLTEGVAWVIAAVVVRWKPKGSITVVIQTIALAAFQVASTVNIGVAISLPFLTLLGAGATSWSSTSISTSCKNQTGNEFHPFTASQVFSMHFSIQDKVKPWGRNIDKML